MPTIKVNPPIIRVYSYIVFFSILNYNLSYSAKGLQIGISLLYSLCYAAATRLKKMLMVALSKMTYELIV